MKKLIQETEELIQKMGNLLKDLKPNLNQKVYLNTSEICEACQIRKQEIADYIWEDCIPFKVCLECHNRLINNALRPLEYFNLAALHGDEGFLDSDSYLDDGTACQPFIEIVPDESLQFPQLADIQDNLERLIDYTFVKWWFPKEVIPYFQKFEKADILDLIQKRIVYNPHLEYRAYDIVAYILGEFAGEWIENRWNQSKKEYIDGKTFSKCLPYEKGYKMVIDFLSKLDKEDLNNQIFNLAYFKNEKTLDFLEQILDKIINGRFIYSVLAASSKFSWPRAEKWFKMGRPLSLIALEAIYACSISPNAKSGDLWLRENPAKLLNPIEIEAMNQVLDDYLSKDNVQRTRNAVRSIKANWELILKDK